MKRLNFIDLFAGCGGLMEGFMQTGKYDHLASVEWEQAPVNTLRTRLKNKWNSSDADQSVILFDMQRTDELLHGFDDPKYGKSKGMDGVVGLRKVDVIIGGPPCQAYSVAGRISDKDNMKKDYRNYLFEYYLKVVKNYQPDLFVFENVPGMLSAMPDGTPIINLIRRDIENSGYEIIDDIRKYALVDANEFGVPQNRHRVILVGLNKEKFSKKDRQKLLEVFYSEILAKYKRKGSTVREAIGDLPKCIPLPETQKSGGHRLSHSVPECSTTWHYARYVSERDMKVYHMLEKDLESGENKYQNADTLCDLYNTITGANTKVHKYHVLRPDEPSTTILAHLYKDGLRFIHYDPSQARSITVREAARLQSFPDDFDFVGSQGDAFKMIGNAVPPELAKNIGQAVYDFLEKYREE